MKIHPSDKKSTETVKCLVLFSFDCWRVAHRAPVVFLAVGRNIQQKFHSLPDGDNRLSFMVLVGLLLIHTKSWKIPRLFYLAGSEDMRIPKDKSLATYIRELIATNHIEKFYKSDDWTELRQEVLEEHHFECYECLKHGEYTKADCVHHVNEVRIRPDLALSKHYTDKDGNRVLNLVPLCNTCHNIVHDKLHEWQTRDKFKNEERW